MKLREKVKLSIAGTNSRVTIPTKWCELLGYKNKDNFIIELDLKTKEIRVIKAPDTKGGEE